MNKKLTIYRKRSDSIKSNSSLSSPISEKNNITNSPKCSSIGSSPYTITKKLYISPSLFSPLSELNLNQKRNLTASTIQKPKNSILDQLTKVVTNEQNEVVKDKQKSKIGIESRFASEKTIKELGYVRFKQPINSLSDSNSQENSTTDNSDTNNEFKILATNFLKAERTSLQEIQKNPNDLTNFIKFNNDINDTIVETLDENFKSADDIFDNFIPKEKFFTEFIKEDIEDIEEMQDEEKELKDSIKVQGELFKLTNEEPKEMKAVYMTLIDQTLFYTKSKEDKLETYYKSRFLSGCFIRINAKENVCNSEYYSFTIISPKSTKHFYHEKYDIIMNWVNVIREAIGYRNFFEFYKLGDTIGKGQFGVIKIGTNLNTNKKVAVKIITKAENKNVDDWSLVRTEIDVMKHSKHPCIIKYIDHFENSDYIFIVMEFLKYGTLQDYLYKHEFNISERMVANIVYQILDALLYLKKYGIIHRDLKPENILIDKKDNKIEVRIMDFGFSKIIGNYEKANEGYGTLAFVSPEVLLKEPYDDRVDIWSLGVIIYYMLSGEIPFRMQNLKIKEISQIIKTQELTFSNKFDTKGQEVKDIIQCCLQKKPEDRIKLEDLIKHPWFKI